MDHSWQLKSGQRCSFSSFHWEVSVYFDECLTCFQANFTTSINPFPLLIDIFSKKRESIFLHPLISSMISLHFFVSFSIDKLKKTFFAFQYFSRLSTYFVIVLDMKWKIFTQLWIVSECGVGSSKACKQDLWITYIYCSLLYGCLPQYQWVIASPLRRFRLQVSQMLKKWTMFPH